MSRYLFELMSLLADLRARYGEDDDSVRQIRCELESIKGKEPGRNAFGLACNRLVPGRVRHSWEGYSSILHSSQRPPPLGSDLRAG